MEASDQVLGPEPKQIVDETPELILQHNFVLFHDLFFDFKFVRTFYS